MDRRMLLAILLSMVVVILFQTFFLPKPARKPTPAEVGSTSPEEVPPSPTHDLTAARGDEPGPSDEVAGTVDPVAGDASGWAGAGEEERIVVETDLYRAEFTNRGGMLRSWRLLRFDDPVGQPVELVLGSRELGLLVEHDEIRESLDDVLFESRRTSSPDGGTRLVFTARRGDGITVEKTFDLPADDYHAALDVRLSGFPAGSGYRLTWEGGIPRAEANHKQYDQAAGTIVQLGKDKETLRPGKFKNESRRELEGNVLWAGVRNKYFMAVMIPPAETSSRVTALGSNEAKTTGAEIIMPMTGGAAQHRFGLWLGPMDYESLKAAGSNLENAVDLGWKFFRPLSKLLLAVMEWMYTFLPNYGWIILIISVVTKVAFYPLTKSSLRSMRAMQRLQPEMTAMRERYKDDPQKQQQAMMALYKEHGVNPVGGCLPIVVQMPVFVALYGVLNNDIAMRGAEWIGWINDLSSPDTIATVGGFAIHLLPLVLTGFTLLQQVLTPQGDPRQKMMGYMMPMVTLFIFYGFPSGLNLYWTVNSVLTVGQQWWIHRRDPHPAPAAKPA